jgi:hypothetical protein
MPKQNFSPRVTDPKNKGTKLCDLHVTDAKGNVKKFRTPSVEVQKRRTSSNNAPKKNFIFGRDKYSMQ